MGPVRGCRREWRREPVEWGRAKHYDKRVQQCGDKYECWRWGKSWDIKRMCNALCVTTLKSPNGVVKSRQGGAASMEMYGSGVKLRGSLFNGSELHGDDRRRLL